MVNLKSVPVTTLSQNNFWYDSYATVTQCHAITSRVNAYGRLVLTYKKSQKVAKRVTYSIRPVEVGIKERNFLPRRAFGFTHCRSDIQADVRALFETADSRSATYPAARLPSH